MSSQRVDLLEISFKMKMQPGKDNCVLPFELESSDMEMDMERYGHWHNAIITDNIDLTHDILGKLNSQEKNKFLNGYFNSKEHYIDAIARKYLVNGSLLRDQKSLTLAYVFGSRQTLKAMLEYGADPLRYNANGDTILHTITSVAKSYPDIEADLAETYVYFMSLLTQEQQRELLYKENSLGLRPLEDAAQKGCITLLKTIFNTPGYVNIVS